MPFRIGRNGFRFGALGRATLAALVVLLIAGCGPAADGWQSRLLPDRVALRSALEEPDAALLRPAYAARGFKPIWLDGKASKREAGQLIRLLETSDREGLSPGKYRPQALRRRLAQLPESSYGERMRTELLLSAAYIEYIRDLHTPSRSADLVFADRDLQPQMRDRAEIISRLARETWAQQAIEDATHMNGLYAQMRQALARQRSSGDKNAATEVRLLLNLDRLRALPADPGDRFVLVDTASNRLWLYRDGEPVDSMKVIVGAADQQTPQLAGLIRYAIYNPFWNVPPDMTRDIYAPRIAANPSTLTNLQMDPWTGFTAGAQMLNLKAVDWTAVAQGQAVGWLRQRPGPHNSMGAVKFMLPNELGIYLHDTPHRELFDKEQRFFSAGCIRVEDYQRLSRWLFQGAEIAPRGAAAEQRFDLPTPVPVYITYLTALPDGSAVKISPDVYGRDRPRLAAVAGPG